jgi:hypothetical protein
VRRAAAAVRFANILGVWQLLLMLLRRRPLQGGAGLGLGGGLEAIAAQTLSKQKQQQQQQHWHLGLE